VPGETAIRILSLKLKKPTLWRWQFSFDCPAPYFPIIIIAARCIERKLSLSLNMKGVDIVLSQTSIGMSSSFCIAPAQLAGLAFPQELSLQG
jgi:hypothetical protein